MTNQNSKIIFVLLTSLLAIFFFTLPAFARIGVGVNLGKIEIDAPLKPGGIYNIPSIGVINTGDEPGEYELAVTFHHEQPQLQPAQEWFNFSPSKFHLEPGQSQNVAIKLSIPVKVKPGDYFCYLEAHPIIKAGPGTTIGVAAATKTYFSVVPANIWQAVYYRISSFLAIYSPWTYVVLSIMLAAMIITLLKKFFAFQINIKIKKKH